jgi:hypothetical protein
MPHRRFLLGSLAYPLSSNISDVARVDYGRYGRINSFAKKLQRRLPLKDRRKIDGFIPVRMRRFARQARKHMLAYLEIGDVSATRHRIDALADTLHTAPSSTMTSRKRKKQHDLPNAQQREATEAARDKEELSSKIADQCEARGTKCRIVSVLDIEIEQTERLARSNEDANAETNDGPSFDDGF